MTPDARARLEQLERQATKGPWTYNPLSVPKSEVDAEFIAALRNAAPALLADSKTLEQIRALRHEVVHLHWLLREMMPSKDGFIETTQKLLALLDAPATGGE